MFVLQHLRDEAHRFAVGFHRRRRSTLTLRSALSDVPGIGPQRQRLLLRHFGSLKKIRDATTEELAAVPGMTAKPAAAVFRYLRAVGVGSNTPATESVVVPGGGDSPDDAEADALESAFADVDDDLEAESPLTENQTDQPESQAPEGQSAYPAEKPPENPAEKLADDPSQGPPEGWSILGH
jgi:hypothetical protein